MFRVLLIVVCMMMTMGSSLVRAVGSFQFPEWLVNEAKERVETLKKDAASLTSEEIHRAEERLKEASAKKDWSAAATEYRRLIGKTPENRDNWLHYSLVLQQKAQEDRDFRSEQEARSAAVEVYQLSKTPEEQAGALLLYGNMLNPEVSYESPSYLEVLQIAKSLTNLTDLKKKHSELASLMPFRYLKTRINNQTATPSVCFSFSHNLAQSGINYGDYFEITPKVDGELKVSSRELCLSPLQYGGNYDVILKAGLSDDSNEKLTTSQKLSFKVKDQNAHLSFTNKAYVLMREEIVHVPLTGVNVDKAGLKIFRVSDRAFNQVMGENRGQFLQNLWDYSIEQLDQQEGELLWKGEMALSTEKNHTVTKQIPFSEVIKEVKPGVYVIQAEEKGALFGEKARSTQWLIISDLGLTAFSSGQEGITVNVRSLKTAKPLQDVEVQLLAYNNSILAKVKTGRDGIARFESNVTNGKGGLRPLLALAYGNEGDFSFLDLKQPAFDLSDRGVSGRKITGNFDAFLYTEQGVYRPNDTVHLNTLLRDRKGIAKGNLPLTFKIFRPDTVLVSEEALKGNELGFYEYSLPLTSGAHTGQWTVRAFLDPNKEAVGEISFLVEDFVPSRILVGLKTDEKFIKPKNPIVIHVDAKYLFGANAVGLEGKAALTLQPNQNPYPQFNGYVFGLVNEEFMNTRQELPLSALDKDGKEVLNVVVDKVPETTKPLEAVVKVTLSDKGGRPEVGVLKLPMVTFPFMIGIKPTFKNNIISESENEANFEIIAIDEKGELKAVSELNYELYQEELAYTWYQSPNSNNWQYQTVIEDKFLSKGSVNTAIKTASPLKVTLTDWGQYRLEIRDPKTGAATSVRFNKGWMTSSNNAIPDQLVLKLDKESYAIDGTVQLEIESPFEGEALLTVANNKVLETQNISVSPKGTRVKLSVKEAWGTGAYCLVSAFRPLAGKTEKKAFLPKRAVGLAWIGIDPAPKTLTVSFELPKEIKPMQTIEVPFQVKAGDDDLSKNAFMTIAAVDEGILKLTHFVTPKPENYFFGKRELGIELRDLYGALIEPLAGPVGVLKMGGDGSLLSRNMQVLSKRSFKVVSLYKGLVALDKNGKGKVSLDIPDFNGSLRLMAVAADETHLGNGEANLLVRDPVVVEGILPRFLAPEDKSELALSLNNVSGKPGEYKVTLFTEGALQLSQPTEGKTEFHFILEKAGTHDLTIPIKALHAGNGRITVVLAGQELNLSKTFELTVREPKPFTTKIENNLLKSDEIITVKDAAKHLFIPGTQLIMGTWSSGVPWDPKAMSESLNRYGYDCVEQTVSKSYAFLLNGPAKSHAVNQSLAILSLKQAADGSFSLWSNDNNKDVWLTAYVVDFLQHAAISGYQVPKFTLERALEWLAQRVKQLSEVDPQGLPGISYALYVLAKDNQVETGSLRYFYDTYYEKLEDAFSRASIANALAEGGDLERATKAYLAVFATSNVEPNAITINGPYGSEVRDNAGVMVFLGETLNKVPTMDKIGALLATLTNTLADKTHNIEQLSTQELAWLIRAAHNFERAKTQKQIKVEINEALHSVEGTTLNVPLVYSQLEKGITVKNLSGMNLWQNIAFSGIPKDPLPAKVQGLVVSRHYFDLEGKPLSLSEIRQGTQCVVILEGIAETNRPHQLLLIDLLPAGLEIENARLAQISGGENTLYPWLTDLSTSLYVESRDDRFVSAINLDQNTRKFKMAYIVRAITPGHYAHPGFFVEDMYAPIFFGRTAEETITIVGKSFE